MLFILFGIATSLSWGGGDFAGGLSSRKIGANRAGLFANFFGLLILAVVSSVYRESLPSMNVFINSFLGGALGSFGILILYYSFSTGQMSIAAPVSALFAALLPVIVGTITEGLPTAIQFIAFAIAFAAVWLISQGEGGFHIRKLSDLRLPTLSGVGFGCYFIFIHYAASDPNSLLWPMVIARMAGTLMFFLIVLVRRERFGVPRNAWGVVLASAMLDLAGNFFYILASKIGRLDITATLAALYPGSTVILAWLILKEKVSRPQVIGIVFALAAILLFTI